MNKDDFDFHEEWAIARKIILDEAYELWREGKLYLYDGIFYDIETDEYYCPCQ